MRYPAFCICKKQQLPFRQERSALFFCCLDRIISLALKPEISSVSYIMFIGVGTLCRTCISYSIVSFLFVSCSGPITSVGEERANFSAIVCL